METLSRLAALAAVTGVLTGCVATYTQQPGGGFGAPQVDVSTPGGIYPLYTPPAGPAAAANLAAPPGFAALPPPVPTGGALDGTYDGMATLLENDFGDCAFRFAMTNMHVNRGHVRFAGFRGRIGPNGRVRMADGSMNWITGHFAGGHFAGSYANEYCAYSLSLDRVGP
jgi:hypothetical protein